MCQRHGVYIWIATGVEICRGQSESYWNLVSPGFSARLPVSLLTTSRGRVYAAHSIGTRFSSYVFFSCSPSIWHATGNGCLFFDDGGHVWWYFYSGINFALRVWLEMGYKMKQFGKETKKKKSQRIKIWLYEQSLIMNNTFLRAQKRSNKERVIIRQNIDRPIYHKSSQFYFIWFENIVTVQKCISTSIADVILFILCLWKREMEIIWILDNFTLST